ncbi:butyrophilin subfamily 1 member A1-like, partial [Clarias magur]
MGNKKSKPDDQEPLLNDTNEEPFFENISVVLLGQHGVGKNIVGNAILKKKAFRFQDRSKTYYLKEEHTTFNRHLTVTRVPGWSADLTSEKNSELRQVIKDSMQSVHDGPHVIILIGNMNTESAEKTINTLKQMFGENVLQHILRISVDSNKFVVNHSANKQTIINRSKYHFLVRSTNGKQHRTLIEAIEDFIMHKQDVRFYEEKKTPNLKLQHEDLANLVDVLKCKISSLSYSLDSNMSVMKTQNYEIRELQRLLKEKEDMLRAKEEEIKRLTSKQNQEQEKIKMLEHSLKQAEILQQKMKKDFKEMVCEKDEIIKEQKKEIEKLTKENQALKFKHKSSSNPPGVIWQRDGGIQSFELSSMVSAETSLDGEPSDVDRVSQFLKKNRKELTERIVAVEAIADELYLLLGRHKYEKILQAPTEYEQRGLLFDITNKGENLKVTGPEAPLVAVVGEDLVLPCLIKPNTNAMDMTVEWFRPYVEDSLVHLYKNHEDRNENQAQAYRGRTSFFKEELQKGNISLKLSAVQVSDEGLFKCLVEDNSWSDDITVHIIVEEILRQSVNNTHEE